MHTSRTILTVGTFDGVHRGHAELIRAARRLAGAIERGGRVVALIFDPHPLSTLDPARAPARLSTFEQRRGWLEGLGVDEVVRLEPTAEMLGLSAEAFVERVVAEHRPAAFVEGPDFRFGRGRTGDNGLLALLGARLNFVADVVAPASVVLDDHSVVQASSTLCRWLLRQGRVRDAARMLGRAYEVTGTVVRGDRRGRTIGYPTANIDTPHLLPADGVYAGTAWLGAGNASAEAKGYVAAISVGTKPTFGESARTLEVVVLDAPKGDGAAIGGLPEYGWEIRLAISDFLRDQVRFDSMELLLAQIARDCERARELVKAGTPEGLIEHSL